MVAPSELKFVAVPKAASNLPSAKFLFFTDARTVKFLHHIGQPPSTVK